MFNGYCVNPLYTCGCGGDIEAVNFYETKFYQKNPLKRKSTKLKEKEFKSIVTNQVS